MHLLYLACQVCIYNLFLLPNVSASGPFQSLGDIFQHQLANLSHEPPQGRNPNLGGADGNRCCLLAINESLEIRDGYLVFRPGQTHLRGDVETFQKSQFPCGASYNGTEGDQPQVWTSYSWCHRNCPGWSVSRSTPAVLGDWVRPLIAFIVPSVIFCLTVGRRRRINVPRHLFPQKLGTFSELIYLFYKIPLASLIVTLDTLIWLVTVMCMSGPMLFSGVYEAVLDVRILHYVQARIQRNKMTIRERAHLLLVILLGNLDLDPAWNDAIQKVAPLPIDNLRRRFSPPTGAVSPTVARFDGSSMHPPSTRGTELPSRADTHGQIYGPYSASDRRQIESAKVQLRSMLKAQTSFGTSVGAAVIFYTGSFIYALIEVQSAFGDSRTAHQIAFGMFWMTVPHVSIISSLLLAGNNPSIWEAVASRPELTEVVTLPSIANREEGSSSIKATESLAKRSHQLWDLVFPPMLRAGYKSAWLWNRGSSKAIWLARFVQEYPSLDSVEEEILKISVSEWTFHIFAPAMFLLVLPSFLGGMISYTTPAVGLSCRSMTVLIYLSAQTLLMLLWLWDYVSWKRDCNGNVRVSVVQASSSIANLVWYTLLVLSIGTSFLTGILGTVFMLIGLYNNCLCYLPIQFWMTRFTSPDAMFYLGGNSSEQIYNSKHYWIPCGISATIFLVSMTYVGWWYQNHLQSQFHRLAAQLDSVNEADIREDEERQMPQSLY